MPIPTISFDELIFENLPFLNSNDQDTLDSIAKVKVKVWFLLENYVPDTYIDFDSYTTKELMVAADYVAYLVTQKETQRMGLSAEASSQLLYLKKEKVDVLEEEYAERKGVLTITDLLNNYKSTLCTSSSELGWLLPICDDGSCYVPPFYGQFFPDC